MSRIEKTRKPNDQVLILTNGKESEKNYFDLVNRKYKSSYKIIVKFLSGAPDYLVNYAIGEVKQYNRIYIVVDVDAFHENIKAALKKSLKYKNKIFIILSNRSFEVWLLNHYKVFTKDCNQTELQSSLDRLFEELGINEKYAKNNKEAIEEYFIPRVVQATINSKVAYQKLYKDFEYSNHREPNELELCSITQIYKVFEELKFKIRKR